MSLNRHGHSVLAARLADREHDRHGWPRRDFLRNAQLNAQKFHVTEKASLEFRAEFFNALNSVSLGPPARDITSRATFGQITSQIGNPRNIQFGLKYAFKPQRRRCTTVASSPVLLETFRSLWFETVTRFVTPGKAAGPTATVSVMVLEAPPSTGPGFVQVTSCSSAEQDQPVPVPETYVNPGGSELVTVMMPAVAVRPTLVMVRV